MMINSVGTLYAIQDLFDQLESQVFTKTEFLSGFFRYGSSTAEEVLAAATALDWVCVAETEQIIPTEFGKRALAGSSRPLRLRNQLSSYIGRSRPTWAGLLPNGRKEVAIHLPKAIYQCFGEAELFDDDSSECIDWWDRISGIMREARQQNLTRIGRIGERLSLSYERERTNRDPVWKSIESNFAGYDLLSIHDEHNLRSLKIEVKASERSLESAEIYISENEWRTALTSVKDYKFHIWLISSTGNQLIVSEPVSLESHIPVLSGKGRWTEVKIPVKALIE